MEIYPTHCALLMGHNTQTERCNFHMIHMRHFFYSVKNAYILMALSSTALNALEYTSYIILHKILIYYLNY
jgi:hypothetical protein